MIFGKAVLYHWREKILSLKINALDQTILKSVLDWKIFHSILKMKSNCANILSKIHQRMLSMFKDTSNQGTDATLKNQLFKLYNFAFLLWKLPSLESTYKCTLVENEKYTS